MAWGPGRGATESWKTLRKTARGGCWLPKADTQNRVACQVPICRRLSQSLRRSREQAKAHRRQSGPPCGANAINGQSTKDRLMRFLRPPISADGNLRPCHPLSRSWSRFQCRLAFRAKAGWDHAFVSSHLLISLIMDSQQAPLIATNSSHCRLISDRPKHMHHPLDGVQERSETWSRRPEMKLASASPSASAGRPIGLRPVLRPVMTPTLLIRRAVMRGGCEVSCLSAAHSIIRPLSARP
jgi:hypothetical protein